MEVAYAILVDPFVQMARMPDFFLQVLWEGLVSGILYSLIALGFVLIFKASGVFNFAQGIMVVFAALSLVGLHAARARKAGTPAACRPTRDRAANTTMIPWAKLKTPEALKIRTKPRAIKE